MTSRAPRPCIFQIGKVYRHADGSASCGEWGVGLCMSGCNCHRHPVTNTLVIAESKILNHLGLASYSINCRCCAPWTVDELEQILRDLTTIEQLPVTTPTEEEDRA